MVVSGMGSSYDGKGKWDISKGIERMHYKAFTAIVPERLLPNDALLKGKLPERLKKGKCKCFTYLHVRTSTVRVENYRINERCRDSCR